MLAKKYRLTKHGSFNYVYRKGSALRSGVISLTYVKGGSAPKVGFSVPNKVGKAVVRNKVRRRMRAVIANAKDSLASAQIVFSASKGACELTYPQIESLMNKLLEKAGLIKSA